MGQHTAELLIPGIRAHEKSNTPPQAAGPQA